MKPGRLLLFDAARTYCRDLATVDAAQDFLQFKLNVAEHVRERILMVINRGVTTFEIVIDPATGLPTDMTKESHNAIAVMELRMWFDLLLFELVSIEDALAQAANVVFEFKESPKNAQLTKTVHERIRRELETRYSLVPPQSEVTGLHDWFKPQLWLRDVRELRNRATHRHLVKLRESKPWDEKPMTPPFRGYLRSECYVDLGDGREEPIAEWVPLTVDKVKALVNSSAKRLADVLTLLLRFHGGEAAAEQRRTWWQQPKAAQCAHPGAAAADFLAPDGQTIYFCTDCGERVDDVKGKKTPQGGTYL